MIADVLRGYAAATFERANGRGDLDALRLYILAYRARSNFEQGEWQAASEDVEAVLRSALATPITRIPALRILGHIRTRRGDPEVNAALDEAWSLGGPAQELQRVGTLAAIRAEAAWLSGDHERVVGIVAPAYALVRERRDPRMHGELAAWLWRVGALDVAELFHGCDQIVHELLGHLCPLGQLTKSHGLPMPVQ